MGVNLGRLGFLTEIPVSEAVQTLDRFLAGDTALVSPRWLLEARTANAASYCLNDAVITKGAVARMIELAIAIDGQDVATLKADGLIVSTPTGSTAYSLSAGGPILHPQVPAIVLTPICPHTLSFRPMAVPATSTIGVRLLTGGEEVHVTFDGQRGGVMVGNDIVEIRKAPFELQLVTSPEAILLRPGQGKARLGRIAAVPRAVPWFDKSQAGRYHGFSPKYYKKTKNWRYPCPTPLSPEPTPLSTPRSSSPTSPSWWISGPPGAAPAG